MPLCKQTSHCTAIGKLSLVSRYWSGSARIIFMGGYCMIPTTLIDQVNVLFNVNEAGEIAGFSSWAWLCKKSQLPTTFEEKTWVQCKWVRKIESHFFKAQTSDLSHFWMGCFEPLWGFQPVGPLRWWLRRKAERKVQGADGGGRWKHWDQGPESPECPPFFNRSGKHWKVWWHRWHLRDVKILFWIKSCFPRQSESWQIMTNPHDKWLTVSWGPAWSSFGHWRGVTHTRKKKGRLTIRRGLHSAWKPPKTTPHLIKTWITITKNQCA